MTYEPRTSKSIVVKQDALMRIAEGYREMLARLDTPAFRSASLTQQQMLHGELAGIRETMRALIGINNWENLTRHESFNGIPLAELEARVRPDHILGIPFEQ